MSLLLALFSSLHDPRVASTHRYPLSGLILITLFGLLAGADNLVFICEWDSSHKDWLQIKFAVENVPSHDTLGLFKACVKGVLAKLDQTALADCLSQWSGALWEREKKPGAVVAFDGKRIKGTIGNLTSISAWASKRQMTLALANAGAGAEKQQAMRDLLQIVNVTDL